jgi:hypothetical protein
MSVESMTPSGSGDGDDPPRKPSKADLDKEEELREKLLVKLGRKRKAAALRTTGKVNQAEVDRQAAELRGERFRKPLKVQRESEAAREITQEAYLADYEKVCGAIEPTGKWQSHYNDDSPENARFKAHVDRSGYDLQGYIVDVVRGATLTSMSFRPGTRPGELSTFRIDLQAATGDDRAHHLTIAGAVTRTGILVFHAGIGG